MKRLPRSLIAFWAAAALSVGLVLPANAAKTFTRGVALDTAISNVGFLDFKTFMTGPIAGDNLDVISDAVDFSSPVTLFLNRTLFHRAADLFGDGMGPPVDYLPRAKKITNISSVTIDVNGSPITLSTGLADAIVRDYTENFRHYGVSGLINPVAGYASNAFLGAATDNIIKQLDALETLTRGGIAASDNRSIATPTIPVANPKPVFFFGLGLLLIGLLRRVSR